MVYFFINPKQPTGPLVVPLSSGGWRSSKARSGHHRQAYAVAKPRDMNSLQRELMQRGPVEVAFFVAWNLKKRSRRDDN